MSSQIALARPDITDREIEAVVSVLRTPNLALGPKLAEFERRFAEFCDVAHAVAVSSGTAALHLLIRGMGIHDGDEVITTPFSFVASTNCILYERATPVFADIDPLTWCINPECIAAALTVRTRAILPVDVFGLPADYKAILSIAKRSSLRVIEDSCEALGSFHGNRPAGTIGDAGVFGFYPNKQITTGEGGMLVTDDAELAATCRSLRNQGRETDGGWLDHPKLGYNYRLSDIACALGMVQLERIKEIAAARAKVAGWYEEELGGEPRIQMQAEVSNTQVSRFVFVVRISDDYSVADRDRILESLRQRGIQCSNYFVPIHLQKYMVSLLGHRKGDFPICEALADRTLALPFHTKLSRDEVATVCEALRRCL